MLLVSILAFVNVSAPTALTGVFVDDFNDPAAFVDHWTSTGVAPALTGGSYVTLTADSSMMSKQMFHHGSLVMNLSLANQTMTEAAWGWLGLPFMGSAWGAFFYYNGVTDKMFAVVGNLTDSSMQITATVPQFNKTEYTEYSIVWSYSSSSVAYFNFYKANVLVAVLQPVGQLQGMDYFAYPIALCVNGTTANAKLSADYVVLSGSIQTVGVTTTTSTIPSTVTSTSTTTTVTPTTSVSISVTVTTSSTLTSTTNIDTTWSTTTSGTYTSTQSTRVSTLTVASATTTIPTSTTIFTSSTSTTTTSVSTSLTSTFSTESMLTTAWTTTTESVTEAPWNMFVMIVVVVAVVAIVVMVGIQRYMRGSKLPPQAIMSPTLEQIGGTLEKDDEAST